MTIRDGRGLAILPEAGPDTLRGRIRRRSSKAAAEKKPPFGEGLFPILDPLTVKELRGLSRHWQNHVGRVLHVGLVAFVLLRWWSEVTTHPGRYTNSDFAVFGRTLFEVFAPGADPRPRRRRSQPLPVHHRPGARLSFFPRAPPIPRMAP